MVNKIKTEKKNIILLLLLVQFTILLLPRRITTAPLIFSSPLLLTLFLISTREFYLSRTKLILLSGIVSLSLINIFLNPSIWINVLVSLVTFSGFYIALAEIRSSSLDLFETYRKVLLFTGSALVVIGTYQLVTGGLPYGSFLFFKHGTPDVLKAFYGSGGQRLYLLLLAPAAIFMICRFFYRPNYRNAIAAVVFSVFIALNGHTSGVMIFFVSFLVWGILKLAAALKKMVIPKRNVKVFLFVLLPFLFFFIMAVRHFGGMKYLRSRLIDITTVETRIDYFTDREEELFAGHPLEDKFRISSVDNLKIRTLLRTVLFIPFEQPLGIVIGSGLGTYSSWAQMILSEYYPKEFIFGTHAAERHIPEFLISRTELSERYVMHYFYRNLATQHYSVSVQPWSSWQTIYAEIGFAGMLLLFFLFMFLWRKIYLRPEGNKDLQIVRSFLIVYTFFFLMMGFIDNYYEYPWLTVPYFTALVFYPVRRRESSK